MPKDAFTPKEIAEFCQSLYHKRLGRRLKAIRKLDAATDQAAVSLLIRALGNNMPEVREAAYQALINKKEQAVPLLIEILQRPYDITQQDIDNSLAAYAQYLEEEKPNNPLLNKKEIEDLIQTVKNQPSSTAENAANCAEFQTGLSGLLIDRQYKWKAAEILGEIADKRAVPILLDSLQDPETWVRGKSALALGKIGDPSARRALEEARRDLTIREEVMQALARIKSVD